MGPVPQPTGTSPDLYARVLEACFLGAPRQVVQVGGDGRACEGPLREAVMRYPGTTRVALIQACGDEGGKRTMCYEGHPGVTVLQATLDCESLAVLYRVKPGALLDAPDLRPPGRDGAPPAHPLISTSRQHLENRISARLAPGASCAQAIEEFRAPAIQLCAALGRVGWADRRVDVLDIQAEGTEDRILEACDLETLLPPVIHFGRKYLKLTSHHRACVGLLELGYRIHEYCPNHTLAIHPAPPPIVPVPRDAPPAAALGCLKRLDV